ncbi:enoyl-CoA hydratase/isomerase family protein [Streptomyces albipurpureus]|uniref:Enoyl-CoA hydratase-related protein n=1 Tax=Streptomyces albipurpureus TaxID=2897419 RepID=A0ABT0UZK4_9ACTN|nr:enoyl-CoA hydratase-related protein [Streptomyces sp. CWNU-1]MCM2393530.1 enoyl-CoA hydratase-related protein [Streptomyces sp. CWNU-1]
MNGIARYSSYEYLTFHRDGHVLTVEFNRPDEYNAIHIPMHSELARVFAEIRRDDDVRAVVLTGRGKAFSAGGNVLKGPRPTAGPALDAFFKDARKIVTDLLEVPQPVIAAINGPAVGLGATLALLCDITLMSRTAIISDPHVTVGVVAGDGGLIAWPWLIGMARAKEYLLTGDKLTAVEAERIGLVNRVVEPEQLLEEAGTLAARLAGGTVRAVQGTKQALNRIWLDTANLTLDAALATEKECFASGDHALAVDAFRKAHAEAKAAKAVAEASA